jgi:hypothetical protein
VTHLSHPATPRWLRFLALALGIILLLWLPIEDMSERGPVLLAAAVCGWWAARFLVPVRPQDRGFWLRHLFCGALAGLATTPVALLLMIFKSGLHGHAAPDFTPAQMQSVIIGTPLWVGSGILLGFGSALARFAKENTNAIRR